MRTSSQLCVKLSRSVSAGLSVDQKAHDRIQIPHEKTFTGTAKNPDHVAYLVSIKPSKKKKSLWNREHWLATDFFFFLEMSKFIKNRNYKTRNCSCSWPRISNHSSPDQADYLDPVAVPHSKVLARKEMSAS